MKGELTRPDFLVPLPSGKVIAVSNKSRNSFLNKKESQIRAQVRRDLEELVEKNSQERYIRRHKDVGPVEINELWLLYDAAMVPSQHKATIRDEVAKFRRVYRESGLTFGVQIL